MPPKYSLEQKADALISTTSALTEALEIQNELRTEFLRSLLARFDRFEASTADELAQHRGALTAIVAELQRLKLASATKPGELPAPPNDDVDTVLVVRVPALRLTRATVGKAVAWVWTKVRAPLLAALLALWLWLLAKLGLHVGQ